jgi:hypothetical protein
VICPACNLYAAGVEVSLPNIVAGLKFSWPIYKSGFHVLIASAVEEGGIWAFAQVSRGCYSVWGGGVIVYRRDRGLCYRSHRQALGARQPHHKTSTPKDASSCMSYDMEGGGAQPCEARTSCLHEHAKQASSCRVCYAPCLLSACADSAAAPAAAVMQASHWSVWMCLGATAIAVSVIMTLTNCG